MEYEGIVVFVFLVISSYLIYDKYYTGNREQVESNVDHKTYTVQSLSLIHI